MMIMMINCPPPWSLRGVKVYFGIFELSTNSRRLVPHTSHDHHADAENDEEDFVDDKDDVNDNDDHDPHDHHH